MVGHLKESKQKKKKNHLISPHITSLFINMCLQQGKKSTLAKETCLRLTTPNIVNKDNYSN